MNRPTFSVGYFYIAYDIFFFETPFSGKNDANHNQRSKNEILNSKSGPICHSLFKR